MGCAASISRREYHSGKVAHKPRVVGATTSDDNLIGLKTFNNRSEIVAPKTLQKPLTTTLQTNTNNKRDVMAEFDKQRRIHEYLDHCVR